MGISHSLSLSIPSLYYSQPLSILSSAQSTASTKARHQPRIHDRPPSQPHHHHPPPFINMVERAVTFTGETDRVYTPAKGPSHPIVISDAGKPKFKIVRDNLDDAVVFNPWIEKAKSLGDFMPKDAWKKMVCVEPGSVAKWQTLEKGDAFEAAQTIHLV